MDSATQSQGTGWWVGLRTGVVRQDCYYPGGGFAKKAGALSISEHEKTFGFRYVLPHDRNSMYSTGGPKTLLWIPFANVTGIHVGASTERRTTGTRALAGGLSGGLNVTNHFTITSASGSTPDLQRVVETVVTDANRQLLVSLRAGAGMQY